MTPPDRLPLAQYIKWLAKTKPMFAEMMGVKGATLTGHADPLQNHSPQRSAGTFLIYHFVNPSSFEDAVFRGTPFGSSVAIQFLGRETTCTARRCLRARIATMRTTI